MDSKQQDALITSITLEDGSFWKDEAHRQRMRADRQERKKGTWILSTFFLGLFTLMTLYSWISTPREARWDVDYDKPIITLVTFPERWGKAERTAYSWGTASDGNQGWLPLDKNGHLITDPDQMLEAPLSL